MDEDTIKRYAKVSEVAWDEAAEVHKEYRYQQLLDGFKRPGFVGMPRERYDILVNHGVQGRAVFQACCNNGRDILSIKNMGASRCMGFDISNDFIQQGKDFATVGVALALRTQNGRCEDIRVALNSVGSTIFRAKKAEEVVRGNPITHELLREMGNIASTEADPIDDQRGSAEYKLELIKVLVRRAGEQALQQIKS